MVRLQDYCPHVFLSTRHQDITTNSKNTLNNAIYIICIDENAVAAEEMASSKPRLNCHGESD